MFWWWWRPFPSSQDLSPLFRLLHCSSSSIVGFMCVLPHKLHLPWPLRLSGPASETWEQTIQRQAPPEKGAKGPAGSLCSRDFGGPWLVRDARLAPSGVSALLEGGQDIGRKAHGPPLLLLYFPFWFLAPFFCRPPPPSVFLISSSLLFFFFFCFLFETGRTSLVQRPPTYTSPDRDRHLDNHSSLVVAGCPLLLHEESHARSNARHACTSRDGSKNKHCKLKASPTRPEMSPYPRPQPERKAFLDKN